MTRLLPFVSLVALITGCSEPTVNPPLEEEETKPEGITPEIRFVSHQDGDPIREDTLVRFVASVWDTDIPHSALSITWMHDAEEICPGATLDLNSETTCLYSLHPGVPEITVQASAGDLTGEATLTVDLYTNQAPTQPLVRIDPDRPRVGKDDLHCLIDRVSTDFDGDDVQYTIDWLVNGAPYTGPTQTTLLSGDTIPQTETAPNQQWTCVITPDDGLMEGPEGTAVASTLCLSGESPECAAESCHQILLDDYSAGDGTYWLDPNRVDPKEYLCDMTTEGGGWTRVVFWDRKNEGHNKHDLLDELTLGVDQMNYWVGGTSNSITWASNRYPTASVFQASKVIPIPNNAEYRFNLHFKGTSWERSGIWFSANTQQGLEEVKCRDTESAGYAGYTSTQLDYIPYPCSKRTGTLNTLNWNQVFSGTASSEITGFDLTSLMADKRNADDKASLYQMIFWVR